MARPRLPRRKYTGASSRLTPSEREALLFGNVILDDPARTFEGWRTWATSVEARVAWRRHRRELLAEWFTVAREELPSACRTFDPPGVQKRLARRLTKAAAPADLEPEIRQGGPNWTN